MKIYLLRHGQSTHNANQDTPHNPDPPLTRLGREQAERTAAELLSANLGAVALYASPQRRALETAAAISRALALPAHVHPDLCEAGGLSDHAGLGRASLLREWPDATLDARITEAGWWTPGTREDEERVFYARAAQALSFLWERHLQSEDSLIVVTHGRFGSALLSTMLGLGPAGYSRYPFDNCGLSRIDYDTHATVAYAPAPVVVGSEAALPATRLRFHNQTSHLPPSHRT